MFTIAKQWKEEGVNPIPSLADDKLKQTTRIATTVGVVLALTSLSLLVAGCLGGGKDVVIASGSIVLVDTIPMAIFFMCCDEDKKRELQYMRNALFTENKPQPHYSQVFIEQDYEHLAMVLSSDLCRSKDPDERLMGHQILATLIHQKKIDRFGYRKFKPGDIEEAHSLMERSS